jgi:FkbM family methyltransferase
MTTYLEEPDRRVEQRGLSAVKVARFVLTSPANRGRRLGRLGDAIAFQARARLTGLPSVTRLGRSSVFLAELHAWPSSKVLYSNPPDYREMTFWRSVLRSGDLFVDIGANAGSYTVWAIDCGASVIAFEPDERSLVRLRRNLAMNGYAAEIHEAAAGESTGVVRFMSGKNESNRLLRDDEIAGPFASVGSISVDEAIGARHVRGMKVDVEGAEMTVLRGAEKMLSERRCDYLQMEWNTLSQENFGVPRGDIAAVLIEHGYRLAAPDARGRLVDVSHPVTGDDLFAVAPGIDR